MNAPLTLAQQERLSLLAELVTRNADRYSHAFFHNRLTGQMCAAGLAVAHRDYLFPGLGLKFVQVNDSQDDIQTLYGGHHAVDELELYFGDGSWAAIFGISFKENGDYPSANEVVGSIRHFRETQQCVAKQPEVCSTPMALVARN